MGLLAFQNTHTMVVGTDHHLDIEVTDQLVTLQDTRATVVQQLDEASCRIQWPAGHLILVISNLAWPDRFSPSLQSIARAFEHCVVRGKRQNHQCVIPVT